MNIDSDILALTDGISPNVSSVIEVIQRFLSDVPSLFTDPEIPIMRSKFEYCLLSSEYSLFATLCKARIGFIDEITTEVLWQWRAHLENSICYYPQIAEHIVAAELFFKYSEDFLTIDLATDLDLIPIGKIAIDDDGVEKNPLYLYIDELLD